MPTVAIVGARRCTKYGENVAYRAAYDLARHGVIVVSGLAYGIDACAHRGCLDAGGVTLAVLGTAINQIYPRSNYNLAQRILERGAILSEYPPDMETRAYNFQIRNRIVSGLADAVLVVEASEHSGTIGTYRTALKQGKEVFAVPADITRPMSVGTNNMLREGAHPYIDASDILSNLGMKYCNDMSVDTSGLTTTEQKIYRAIKRGVQSGDAIIEKLNISAMEFNQAITTLELEDYVQRQGQLWTIPK